ncbi:MAG TPA: DUF2142 domain-containing protein, partial [Propionibacteriaceae bacterium]
LWNLGWLDTTMPSIVYISMIVVCAFMLMAGLSQLPLMKTVVAVGGILFLVALPLYILNTSHLLVGQDLQPRYLLPLLPVISLVILTGARPDQTVRLPKPVAWLTWIMVSTANAVALLMNIRRYTTGTNGPLLPGRATAWWMPGLPGPLLTLLAGAFGFALVAWSVVWTSREPAKYGPPTLPAEVEQRSLPSDGTAIPADSPRSTPVPERVEGAPVAGNSDDTPVRQA